MSQEPCWAGIDVSKAALNVDPSYPEQALSLANAAHGLFELVATLQTVPPALIVLEAAAWSAPWLPSCSSPSWRWSWSMCARLTLEPRRQAHPALTDPVRQGGAGN